MAKKSKFDPFVRNALRENKAIFFLRSVKIKKVLRNEYFAFYLVFMFIEFCEGK